MTDFERFQKVSCEMLDFLAKLLNEGRKKEFYNCLKYMDIDVCKFLIENGTRLNEERDLRIPKKTLSNCVKQLQNKILKGV